jgi:hypothetical protein
MRLGAGIRKKPIPDPGSRGQNGTGSRIWIRNTAFKDACTIVNRRLQFQTTYRNLKDIGRY